MNANELADYLDNNVEAMIMSEQTHIDQAATMIRQQQAEIESLKAQVLAWENAEVPVEVMADIVEELERRGFITK